MKRLLPAGTSVLLIAVVAVFRPVELLPSFDTVKLAVLVPLVAVLCFVAARRRDPDAAETSLRDPILLVPALVALAAAGSAVLSWPRGSLQGPTLAIACVAAARLVPRGADGLVSTARAAAAVAAGVALYGIAQKLGLDPAPWADRREAVSTLGNTSFAAEFQAAALPFAVFLALRPGTGPRDRLLGRGAVLLALVHLVLARSRIDFVAAGAAGVTVAVCALENRRAAAKLAVGALLGAAALAVLFVAAAQGEVGFLGRSDTLEVRARIWRSSLALFTDAPFRFGSAPFLDLFPPWRDPEEYRISLGRIVDTPHMDLLEIATTLGVVGLVATLAWCVAVAHRLVGLRGVAPWECAALAGCVVAVGVSGLASSPLTHPGTALLLALAAGHVAALVPRPGAGRPPTARATDLVVCAVLLAATWPGPAFRTFQGEEFLALGRSRAAGGDTRVALELLDRAANSDAQGFDARFELGTALLGLGQRAEAAEALAAAHAIRPNDPECRTNLVYALRECGRTDEADRLLAESLRLVPWHPLLLTARAAAASARGDFDSATADLDRAAALRPWDLRMRAVRADARLGCSPDDEAVRTEALDVLVAVHRAKDFRLLAQAARAFTKRDRFFLAMLVARARRIAAEDPDLAVALVRAPVEGLSPEDAGFFEESSKVLQACGREEEARIHLGRGLGLRAREALAAGDADRAHRLAVRASERDPLPDHLVTEALCLARTADRRAVKEALAAAATRGPIDAERLRADPAFAALLPDPELEILLSRGRATVPARKP